MFENYKRYVKKDIRGGRVELITKEKTEAITLNDMRIMRDGLPPVPIGKWTRLLIDGDLWMSNTPMETVSNYGFCRKAHGKVLIGGLGMGLMLSELLPKKKVDSITVIEIDEDVVETIAPLFADDKLKIVEADIFDWKPNKGEKFDCIFFDIWQEINVDNLQEINRLHKKFKNYINRQNTESLMQSWMQDFLRILKRRGY